MFKFTSILSLLSFVLESWRVVISTYLKNNKPEKHLIPVNNVHMDISYKNAQLTT